MKRYERYKEVNLPWLKEVPEGWDFGKNRNVFKYKKEINKNNLESNVLSLTLNGVINNDVDNPIGLSPKDYATYQIFDGNDLVFKLIDLNNIKTSRVGLVHERGIMSSAYIRLCTNNKNVNCRYFYFWFFKLYKEEVFNKLGNGVRETIGKDELLNMGVPIPPLSEQEQIAAFLDWKISEIDRLITLEREKILFFDEIYRNRLNVTFNNITGENKKLRFVFKFGKGLNITKENLGDNGEKCISYGEIHGLFKFSVDSRSPMLKKLSKIEGINITETAKLSKGDFVFADTSEDVEGSGDFSFVSNSENSLYAGYHAVVAKPITEFNDYFMACQFESDLWRKQIRSSVNGIKVYSITQQILKQSSVVLPDLDIQTHIAEELKTLKSKIDGYKDSTKLEIEHLTELKQTLISDAVTGKIDVRDIDVPEEFRRREAN